MPGKEKIIPIISLPLAAFTITASVAGLLAPGFYAKETRIWATQSLGQDIIDLFFITPVLIVTSILASQKNKTALPIWAGTNLYLAYTFAIYCFDVHFNQLFLFYCFCFGLSVFSFIYFLVVLKSDAPGNGLRHKTPLRFIGIYFIIISVLFYFLWLADIFPFLLKSSVPTKLAETGMFTNPVEVLDLSLVLPSIFVTGIFLLNGRSMGFVLTPVILTFIILMDLTISVLTVYASINKVATDISIAIVMTMLGIFSAALLIIYFINIRSRNLRYYNDP
ncbi:MAG TPA: hypothetical protein VG676_00705 [Chitinophagaceae bacterium]|jgi:hypothetical protein|nr:hypothetical protein [Chitinophagaceae bacterium]